MVKAVFLDRDGVINANLERNGKQVAPTNLAEFRIFPDVGEAALLRGVSKVVAAAGTCAAVWALLRFMGAALGGWQH